MKTNEKVQLAVRITPDCSKELKIALAKRGQSVQFILEKAINAYIEETKSLESSGQL